MIERKLVRFLIAGVGCALFYFSVSWLLQARFAVPPFLATAGAYICSFCAAYLLQRSWAFRSDVRHAVTLPRYAAAQTLAALLTAASTQALASLFPATSTIWLAAAGALVAGGFSFVISSTWVFAHGSNPAQ